MQRPVTNLLLTPEQIAEKIRPTVDRYQQAFPALLEIPSKDHPYGTFALFGELVTDCRRPFEGFYIEACAEARRRMTDERDPYIHLLRLSEVFRRTIEVYMVVSAINIG